MIHHSHKHGRYGCDLKAGYIWCNGEHPLERILHWELDETTQSYVQRTVLLYDKDRSMSEDAIKSMHKQFRDSEVR